MHALHHEILPPSGVEFATSLKLTPSTLAVPPNGSVSSRRTLCNLVVARSNLLRIFEVCEEQAPFPSPSEEDKEGRVKKGTEAVDGEVEMDGSGDGFVNIAKVIRVLCELNRGFICVHTSNFTMLSSVCEP
jgi:cleavage and polyadenylation specificity factor subunit 1